MLYVGGYSGPYGIQLGAVWFETSSYPGHGGVTESGKKSFQSRVCA